MRGLRPCGLTTSGASRASRPPTAPEGAGRRPGLTDHADHALMKRAMGGRASGIVRFGVQGGRDGGARFQDALKLFTRLVNIGDARSLACQPASTAHR